jgi:hypothetical protein
MPITALSSVTRLQSHLPHNFMSFSTTPRFHHRSLQSALPTTAHSTLTLKDDHVQGCDSYGINRQASRQWVTHCYNPFNGDSAGPPYSAVGWFLVPRLELALSRNDDRFGQIYTVTTPPPTRFYCQPDKAPIYLSSGCRLILSRRSPPIT